MIDFIIIIIIIFFFFFFGFFASYNTFVPVPQKPSVQSVPRTHTVPKAYIHLGGALITT
jgi:hypothetical protein